MMKKYPNWVCLECGREAAKNSNTKQLSLSTWHTDTCDVCQKEKACTQPRDFGNPVFKGHQGGITWVKK